MELNKSSKATKKRKKKTKVKNKEYCCETCNVSFVSKSGIEDHFKKRHTYMFCTSVESNDSLWYKCSLCNQTFSQKDDIMIHAATRACIKKYVCEICGKKFEKNYQLVEHKKYHSNDNSLKCLICHKIFSSAATLKRHEMVHLRLKGFKCDKCHKRFRRRDQMYSHRLTHLDCDLKCGICNRRIYTNVRLRVHIKQHWTGELDCKICSKQFIDRNYWADHLLLHSGIKPLKCKICDESFALKKNLTLHTENHIPFDIPQASSKYSKAITQPPDVYLYNCDTCNAGYSTKHSLQTHIKTHIEKRYNCLVCNKFFKGKGRLKKHELTHKHTVSSKNTHQEQINNTLVKIKPKLELDFTDNEEDYSSETFHHSDIKEDVELKYLDELNTLETIDAKNEMASPKESNENALSDVELKTIDELENLHQNNKITPPPESPKYKEEKDLSDVEENSSWNDLSTSVPGLQKPCQEMIKASNSEKKTFQCEFCNIKYKLYTSLSHHLKKVHTDLYSRMLSEKKALRLKEKMNQVNRCEVCDITYKRKENLTMHNIKHHNIILGSLKVYRCEVCDITYKRKENLTMHNIKHHNIILGQMKVKKVSNVKKTQFSCESCNIMYARKKTFLNHMKNHNANTFCQSVESNNAIAFKCNFCNQIFSQKDELIIHTATQSCFKKYVCDVCGKIFEKRYSFTEHLKFHSNDYKCKICQKIFTRKETLQHHQNIHMGLRPFICEICSKSFRKNSLLKRHRLVHSEQKFLKCCICEKKSKWDISLRRHIKRHWVGELDCKVCIKQCVDRNDWEDHSLLHCGVKPLKCKVCDENFASKRNLTLHLENHTPFDIALAMSNSNRMITKSSSFHFCDTCNSSFSTTSSLEKHKKSHSKTTSNMKRNCPVCDENFASKRNLTLHLENHTPFDIALAMSNSNEMITKSSSFHFCDTSNSSFSTMSSLEKHKKSHNKTKRNIKRNCSVCNKYFKEPDHLKKHELIHTRIKVIKNEYKCGCCSKLFASKQSFYGHINWHSKENPLFCSENQKIFDEVKTFRDHMLVHSGYGSLICPKCGERFAFKSVFDQHLNKHRDFLCDLCTNAYKTKSHLVRHINKQHKDLNASVATYSCSKCQIRFPNSSALRRHVKFHAENVGLDVRKEFVDTESIESSNFTIKDEANVLDEENMNADAAIDGVDQTCSNWLDGIFKTEEDVFY